MLTYSPIPKWRDLIAALFMKKVPSVAEMTQPWCREGEVPFLFSRSCFSLQAIVHYWQTNFNKAAPVIWIPDYICNQSLQALRTTTAKIIFYPVTAEFNPDWQVCTELAALNPPDIFMLVHYFGRCADVVAAKRFGKAYNTILVEDAAHVLTPTAGIGERGDFILYSPHKLLPVPNGAICVMRNAKAEAIAAMEAAITQLDTAAPSAWPWVIKKIIQKLLLLLPIKRTSKLVAFDIDPAATMQRAPRMSKLAKKLLLRLQNQLPAIANMLSDHTKLWHYLIQTKVDVELVVVPNANTVPYVALFRNGDYAATKSSYQTLGTQNFPVQTWPDLPAEVIANPARHSAAITLRKTLFTLPVVFSFSSNKLANQLLPKLNTYEYRIEWNSAARDTWENLFATVDKSNILQSWGYGQAKAEASAWQVMRGIIYQQNEPVALLQALEKSFYGAKLIRINRGPSWLGKRTAAEKAAIYALIKRQWSIWRRYAVFFSPEQNDHITNRIWLDRLKFWPLPLGKWSSAWIDLQQTATQLRQALNGKWRNQLKSAEVAGLQCQHATDEVFAWLMERYVELQADKQFNGLPVTLVRAIYSHRYRKSDFLILRALYNDIPVAAVLVIVHGTTATYLIGWNSNEGRDLCAHNFLLWNALLVSQQQGCTWFDVGGIDGVRTPGVARFKQGLNGEEYRLVGEYLCI